MQAKRHQQDRAEVSGGRVVGQDADQTGRDAHDRDRHDEGLAPADAVAELAEQDRAQRSSDESESVREERGEEPAEDPERLEEQRAEEERRQIAEDVEVVGLE